MPAGRSKCRLRYVDYYIMQEKIFLINSPDETESLAYSIGQRFHGGECIELVSDLGGGKTTFTRGLVRGLGSFDSVSSPTFTIGKQYKTESITCYHFDFYRLLEPGLAIEELAEALEDNQGVIVVEWAESVASVLPEKRIVILFENVADNSQSRKCIVKYPSDYHQIMELASV